MFYDLKKSKIAKHFKSGTQAKSKSETIDWAE